MAFASASDHHTLIFELLGKFYGAPAPHVAEILRLPEVTPLEDAPSYIIGVINLRGRVVPVLDLNLRLGRVSEPYRLSDVVVVLEEAGELVAVVTSDVVEVRLLDPEQVDPLPAFVEGESRRSGQFLWGVARLDDNLVALLDVHALRHAVPVLPEEPEWGEEEGPQPHQLSPRRVFNARTDDEGWAVLRERARRLRQPLTEQDGHGSQGVASLAVLELHGECVGIDLRQVRGFTPVRQVAAVPCTPAHVVGDMNLRGEVLTLIDLTALLGIARSGERRPEKAVVVEVGEIRAGVLIHEVLDVIPLVTDDLSRAPAAGGALRQEFLRGVAPHAGGMVSLLDLDGLFASQELVVREEV